MTPAEEAELAALEAEFGTEKSASKLDELLGGLKHSAISTGHGIGKLLPQALAKHLPSEETYQKSKEFVDNASAMADVGSVGGDVLQGLIPGMGFLKAGQALKLATKLPGIAALTDIGGNAAYNAAVSPEDKGTAAMLGGAGAVGGRVLNRALSGPLAPAVSPEARRLLDAGVTPTPGQLIKGTGAGATARGASNLEDSAHNLIVVGDVIKHRSMGGIEDWNKLEINNILKDAGIKAKSAGLSSIDDAAEEISTKIDTLSKNVDVDADHLGELLDDLAEARKHHSMLNDAQRNKVDQWIELNIKPLIKEHIYIPMSKVRQLDKGIRAQAQKAALSKDPMEASLAEAYGEVHKGLRSAFEGVTSPKDADELRKLFKAEDELDLVQRASLKSSTGVFSPTELQAEYQRAGKMLPQSLKDAKVVLPKKVPETGSSLRGALHSLITPTSAGAALAGGAHMLGGFGPLAATGTAALAAYTRPGAKYLASGIKPLLGKKLTQEEMEYVIKLLGTQGARAAGNELAGE